GTAREHGFFPNLFVAEKSLRFRNIVGPVQGRFRYFTVTNRCESLRRDSSRDAHGDEQTETKKMPPAPLPASERFPFTLAIGVKIRFANHFVDPFCWQRSPTRLTVRYLPQSCL